MDLERLLSIAFTGLLLTALIGLVAWWAWDFVRTHGIVLLLVALMAAGFVALMFAGHAGVFNKHLPPRGIKSLLQQTSSTLWH
jgi:uncharacterized membrane protein YqjE